MLAASDQKRSTKTAQLNRTNSRHANVDFETVESGRAGGASTIRAIQFAHMVCGPARLQVVRIVIRNHGLLIKQMMHGVGRPISQTGSNDVSAGFAQGPFDDGGGYADGAHAGTTA